MDALPEFELLRPTHARRTSSRRAPRIRAVSLLGGGTDLVVNIRRGIVAPPVLIDVNHVARAAQHQGRRERRSRSARR